MTITITSAILVIVIVVITITVIVFLEQGCKKQFNAGWSVSSDDRVDVQTNLLQRVRECNLHLQCQCRYHLRGVERREQQDAAAADRRQASRCCVP